MRRLLSLACGLALAAPAAAQDRPTDRPAPPRPTDRPGAAPARNLEVELERLRAEVRELQAQLRAKKDAPKPDIRRDAGPKTDVPKPDFRRDVAPMPKAKGADRGPEPKGPQGGGGGFGFGGGSFGPKGPMGMFGGGGSFGPGGPMGPGGFGGPKGPMGPMGPGGFGPPPFARGGGAGPADLEQRLDRIIDELERLRDDLRRGPRPGPGGGGRGPAPKSGGDR